MDSIVALIEKVEPRPAMYIGQRSISCLAAYIDGWCDAKGDCIVDSDLFCQFKSWIADKFSAEASHSWDKIILFHSQDEADAIDTFFNLFKEFGNAR